LGAVIFSALLLAAVFFLSSAATQNSQTVCHKFIVTSPYSQRS